MNSSFVFQPVTIEQEQSTNGGAGLAALGVFAGAASDIMDGKPVPVPWKIGRRVVFCGTAAAAGAALFGIPLLTASLSNPKK